MYEYKINPAETGLQNFNRFIRDTSWRGYLVPGKYTITSISSIPDREVYFGTKDYSGQNTDVMTVNTRAVIQGVSSEGTSGTLNVDYCRVPISKAIEALPTDELVFTYFDSPQTIADAVCEKMLLVPDQVTVVVDEPSEGEEGIIRDVTITAIPNSYLYIGQAVIETYVRVDYGVPDLAPNESLTVAALYPALGITFVNNGESTYTDYPGPYGVSTWAYDSLNFGDRSVSIGDWVNQIPSKTLIDSLAANNAMYDFLFSNFNDFIATNNAQFIEPVPNKGIYIGFEQTTQTISAADARVPGNQTYSYFDIERLIVHVGFDQNGQCIAPPSTNKTISVQVVFLQENALADYQVVIEYAYVEKAADVYKLFGNYVKVPGDPDTILYRNNPLITNKVLSIPFEACKVRVRVLANIQANQVAPKISGLDMTASEVGLRLLEVSP